MIKSIALEQHNSGFRAIIFSRENGVDMVEDIAETDDLGTLNAWVSEFHDDVQIVKQVGEPDIIPDCLTAFETAECVMHDLRT